MLTGTLLSLPYSGMPESDSLRHLYLFYLVIMVIQPSIIIPLFLKNILFLYFCYFERITHHVNNNSKNYSACPFIFFAYAICFLYIICKG